MITVSLSLTSILSVPPVTTLHKLLPWNPKYVSVSPACFIFAVIVTSAPWTSKFPERVVFPLPLITSLSVLSVWSAKFLEVLSWPISRPVLSMLNVVLYPLVEFAWKSKCALLPISNPTAVVLFGALTVNLCAGLLVPIPILPLPVIIILSCSVPPSVVENIKLEAASSLSP